MPEQTQEGLEISLAAVRSMHQDAMSRARIEHSEQGAFRIAARDGNYRLHTAQSPARA